MRGIEKIKAFLNLGATPVEMGEMVLVQNKIYFKFTPDFVARGVEISPFKMKLTDAVKTPKELHFEGLFGVFADSLPDGWGRLLLDRKLLAHGISPTTVSPLDRLAYLDKNGMGAITYQPEYTTKSNVEDTIDLDTISNEIETVLSGNSADVIDTLYQLGGSSGGARPKILVGFNPETDELIYGKEQLPDGFEHWIIKFPSSSDYRDIARIEYAYNVMAQQAEVEVSEFRLFKSGKGQYFFGSKRFDRINNEKLHLHSVAGLLHDNFRMSTLDYGHIMDCAFTLEKDFNAYHKVLRLAAFNVLAHNRDDHSKNFSFLMDKNGKWRFAPAYDLTFSHSGFGHHSTTVAGEGKNPGVKHLAELARHFGIKKPEPIFEEVQEAIGKFNVIANNFGITDDSKKMIVRALKNR